MTHVDITFTHLIFLREIGRKRKVESVERERQGEEEAHWANPV